MDFRHVTSAASASPSSSDSSPATATANGHIAASDPMQSWWESISLARTRIHSLSSLLPSAAASLSSLADSDRPALSLLSSHSAYSLLSSSLLSSGSGSDPLCHWLYDTYLSSDPHLRLVVLSSLPLLTNLYLTRVHSDTPSPSSLAGFEAVLLSIYASETKSRNGKSITVSIPDLSQPSLYHTPRKSPNSRSQTQSRPLVGVISPPLEPQNSVKSTKRACIVGVSLDCYFKQISQMPHWSKLDFCKFVADWAGQDCPCKDEFDFEQVRDFSEINDEVIIKKLGVLAVSSENNGVHSEVKGVRIPLPWEILQPILRILGHCLLAPLNVAEVKEKAAVAVRCLYARASHDLVPQAILATRSLIQLDKRRRESEKAAAVLANGNNSSANTPSKGPRKPEVLLVSK